MIKRAQISFICITMSIVMVVFSAIVFVVFHKSEQTKRATAEVFLNEMIDDYVRGGEKTMINGVIIVNGDRSAIDEIELPALKAVAEIYYDNSPDGIMRYRGNVFFKSLHISETNTDVFVAVDVSSAVKIIRQANMPFVLFLSLVYVLLFVLVWSVSYKIFEPIRIMINNQKRFISDASHELKTPVTVISANADVLIKNEGDNQWINNIKSQTKRLNLLIADLLTLAKLDEKKTFGNSENFNLSQEVLDSTLPFEALAYEKGKSLSVNISEGIKCYGDRAGLKKVVNILVDNAIKYSTDGEPVDVSLSAENSKATLSVYNKGSNVDEKDENKVFDRFFRSDDSRSRDYGGSGLGLSIAKSICDVNGWKISAKTVKDSFMKITVAIPCSVE